MTAYRFGIVAAVLLIVYVAALMIAAPRSAPQSVSVPRMGRSGLVSVAVAGRTGAPHEIAGTTGLVSGLRAGSGAPLSAVTFSGFAGWAVPSLGRTYLAMRLPRGTVVEIAGPGGTWTTPVTDYGPDGRIPGRIADIAVGQWERICAVPRAFGLCSVVVTIQGRLPLAPSTDLEVTP